MNQKTEPEVFAFEEWQARLSDLASQYGDNLPFPHLALEDFLAEPAARTVLDQFPGTEDAEWTQYKHYNESTLGTSSRDKFPPAVRQVVDTLTSDEFVDWLSRLTGIPNLQADPNIEGGGMHQTEAGGFLNVHADFQMHPHEKTWRRRVNLILYLNPEWKQEWGGCIEFWDREMKNRVKKISPEFNRVVIFNTNKESFHGYPDPMRCPQGITRKSLALYYYTVEADANVFPKPSRYYARPEDGLVKRLCIQCDNTIVAAYSWVKRTFRLSDRFASRILKILARMKK